ncbi:MAG: ATP-binding protein [Pseudomonadota bacterium]
MDTQTNNEQLTNESNPDQDSYVYRWNSAQGPISITWNNPIQTSDLLHIDDQASQLLTNTQQFLAGLPANNVLLWGSRGTGKSSLLQAIFNQFTGDKLYLIEIARNDFQNWPKMISWIQQQATKKFIIFCDDISFNKDDIDFNFIKAALEGSLTSLPENALIYATSNRRHLIPEKLADNQHAEHIDGEIHHNEAVEEAISLSDRFGLWLSFHALTQQQYLDIVKHWLNKFGINEEENSYREVALRWALQRGSRSGRIANQFARDYAGKQLLNKTEG